MITRLLVNAFRCIVATTPADLLPTVYLCTNRVAPAHEGVELGIGDAKPSISAQHLHGSSVRCHCCGQRAAHVSAP